MAGDGDEMQRHLKSVLYDPSVAAELVRSGLETIHARHTCAHRVDELLRTYEAMKPATVEENSGCPVGIEA
jgi:spore maturation protein CgeB